MPSSQPTTIFLEEMTWSDVHGLLKDGRKVILVPTGSIEQHGPHLPITTDVILPVNVARGVAERTKTIVATPIYYGMQSKPLSGGGQSFPGTTSLRGMTLIALVRDIAGEFIRQGFKKITVLTWHMENIGFTYEGADLAMREAHGTDARATSGEDPRVRQRTSGNAPRTVRGSVRDQAFPRGGRAAVSCVPSIHFAHPLDPAGPTRED